VKGSGPQNISPGLAIARLRKQIAVAEVDLAAIDSELRSARRRAAKLLAKASSARQAKIRYEVNMVEEDRNRIRARLAELEGKLAALSIEVDGGGG
jgi:hypothetical protein